MATMTMNLLLQFSAISHAKYQNSELSLELERLVKLSMRLGIPVLGYDFKVNDESHNIIKQCVCVCSCGF